MENILTVLHLSDLHERGPREPEVWRRRRVLGDAFLQGLDAVASEFAVDLLCFTGDLADWGRAEEYAGAGMLLSEVLQRLHLPGERLFLVPGNHDVDRRLGLDAWGRLRRDLWRTDFLEVSRWLRGGRPPLGFSDEDLAAVLGRQQAYRAWLREFGQEAQLPAGSPHGQLGYRTMVRLERLPFPVYVCGLDSTWMAGDDADSGKLLLTEDQVVRLCSDDGRPLDGFRLALIHHPLSDLQDGAACRRHLAGHVDLLLRGHLHETEPELWADPDHRLLQFAAGCLYEGHRADQHENSYQIIQMTLDRRGRPQRFRLHFRTWSTRRGFWFKDSSLYRGAKDGCLTLGADGQTQEEARPSLFQIPYEENQFFTGREDLLGSLRAVLLAQGGAALSQPQALSGLGGIGKTQIALAYAYRFRGAYRAVFWISAESEALIEAGFVQMAEVLGLPLPERGRPAGETRVAVLHWLETQAEWLLVLDGADQPEALRPFLPRRPRGHVLITTRAQMLQRLGIVTPREVTVLSPEEALTFLLRRTGRHDAGPGERAAASALAQELGHLPLALEQASAYIADQRAPFADYLTSYLRQGVRLLSRSEPLEGDYPRSVATTWSMNLDEVKKRSREAVLLMRMCAFLAPDHIPVELVVLGASYMDPRLERRLKDAPSDPVVISELLEPLRRYSLVRRDLDHQTISMHRMVQEVIKDSLHRDHRREYAGRIVRALAAVFPDPAVYVDWAGCDRFLPHARAALELCQEWRIRSEEAARLHNQVALHLEHQMQSAEAEVLYRRGIAIREEIHASPAATLQNHLSLAVILSNLGALLYQRARLEEAEELLRRAVTLLEQCAPHTPALGNALIQLSAVLGNRGKRAEADATIGRVLNVGEFLRSTAIGIPRRHLVTFVGQLAQLLLSRGRYAEADPLLQRAIDWISQDDPGSPFYANLLSLRGRLQRELGNYREAERLCLEAVQCIERSVGRRHRLYAEALAKLAAVDCDQGRYQEALAHYQQQLVLEREVLGDRHPNIIDTLGDLGGCYRHLGRYAEAEACYKEMLALQESLFGKEYAGAANNLGGLGLLYIDQDRFAEAESVLRSALEVALRDRGARHADTGIAYNNLAIVHEALGRYSEASRAYEQALSVMTEVFGEEHPDTCLAMHNLGRLYTRQEHFSEAQPLYEKALVGWQKSHGPRHPRVAAAMESLAVNQACLGRTERVEEWLRQAAQILTDAQGPEHPDCITCLIQLGQHYHSIGRSNEACPILKEALAILERTQPGSLAEANCLFILAACLVASEEYAPAEAMLRRSLSIAGKHVDADNPIMASLQSELGACLLGQGQLEEADALFARSYEALRAAHGEEHPAVARVQMKWAELRQAQGRLEEAASLAGEARAVLQKTLGQEHPQTAMSLATVGMIHAQRGDLTKAREAMSFALQGMLSSRERGPFRVDPLRRMQADLDLHSGDLAKAEVGFAEALRDVETQFGTDDRRALTVLLELGATQLLRGELTVLEATLDRAQRIQGRAAGVMPGEQAQILHLRGNLYLKQGKLELAHKDLRRAIELLAHHDDAPSAELASVHNSLASVLEKQRDYAAACTHYASALALLPGIADTRLRDELKCVVTSNLANNLESQGLRDRATELREQSDSMLARIYGPTHPSRVIALQCKAAIAQQRGEWNEAKGLYEEALAAGAGGMSENHPDLAAIHRGLGEVLLTIGQRDGARRHLSRALEISQLTLTENHPRVRLDLRACARCAHHAGDLDLASTLYRRAGRVSRLFVPTDPLAVAHDESDLSIVLHEQGELGAARAACERAVEVLEPSSPPPSAVAAVRTKLAEICMEQGDHSAAVAHYRAAIDLFSADPGDGAHLHAVAHNNLAILLEASGANEEAREHFLASLRLRRTLSTLDSLVEQSTTLSNLATLLSQMGEAVQAESYHQAALSCAAQGGDAFRAVTAGWNYAQFLESHGRAHDALKLLEARWPQCQETFGPDDPMTSRFRDAMAGLRSAADPKPPEE